MPPINVTGTTGNDTLEVTATSATGGSQGLNGVGSGFSDATSFSFDGLAGDDLFRIINPVGSLFSPPGGITFNGGGQPGDALEWLGGAAFFGNYQATGPDSGTIVHTATERQQLTVGGSSGTFTLTFNGQTTAPLAFNATAAQVQSALNGLPSFTTFVGAVSVIQTGNVYTITFGGAFLVTNQSQITTAGAGGASPTTTTILDGGPHMLTFTGLAPVTDTVNEVGFGVTATAGADTVTVTDGGLVGGQATTQIASPTFESMRVANKAALAIDGNGGSDTLNFNNPTPPAGLTTFRVFDFGAVTQTGAINYPTLSLVVSGPVTLTGNNDVDVLAADLEGVSGAAFSYHDVDDILISTDSGVHGISTFKGAVTVTTGNGAIVVANTVAPLDVSADSSTLTLTAGGVSASESTLNIAALAGLKGSAGVTLTADNMVLGGVGGAPDIDAGGNIATLQPFRAEIRIDLGSNDGAGALGLTDAELDSITAGILRIGNSSSGDIRFGATIAPDGTNQLELITAAAVDDSNFGIDVTISRLAISAGDGIGIDGAIDTTVGSLEAQTDTGGILVTNTGNLTIGGVNAGLSGVRVVNSGNIALAAAGITLADTGNDIATVSGGTNAGNVALTAAGATADVTSTVNQRAIRAEGGDVTVTAGRNILLGTGGIGFNNDISAHGNITLNAGRDIILDGSANVTGNAFSSNNGGQSNIALTAGRNITITDALAGIGINTAEVRAQNFGIVTLTTGANGVLSLLAPQAVVTLVGEVIVNADRVVIDSDSGIVNGFGEFTTIQPASFPRAINLGSATDAAANTLELSDAELDRIDTATLRIGSTANTGNITVSSPITASSYNTLSLRTGGAIVDGNATGQDITVDSLALRAGAGIGTGFLETDVASLAFNNINGPVSIDNNGAMIIDEVDGLTASANLGGATNLSAEGPITIARKLTSAGGMTIATDGPGSSLTVLGGVTVQSTGGGITLAPEGDLIFSAFSTLSASGTVEAFVGNGGSSGATATLNGTIISPFVAVAGNNFDDTFNVGFVLAGNVTLTGDAGTDTLVWDNGGSSETFALNASGANAVLTRDLNPLTLTTNTIERLTLRGNGGNDQFTVGSLAGTSLMDVIIFEGGEGNDTLNAASASNVFNAIGGGGDDQLATGAAVDVLSGGGGNDDLNGGIGTDDLTGGAGADDFIVGGLSHGADLIRDLSTLEGDRVALRQLGFLLPGTGTLQAAGVDFVHGFAPRTAAPTIIIGSNVFYDQDGTGIFPAVLLAQIGVAQFSVVTTGDFNADGADDLLWRDAAGTTIQWMMSGSGGIGFQAALPSTSGYTLVADGDFDGNGTADLIWKHDANGETIQWLTSPAGGVDLQAALPNTNGYSVVGVGNFDAGGTADIVWKNAATGETIEWLFSTAGGVGFQASLFNTNGYSVLDTGDYNRDGTEDFLWREDATGNTIEWLMATTAGVGFQAALLNVTGYRLVATGDYDANGTDDFLWKNLADGGTIEWLTSPTGGIGFQAALLNLTGYDLVASGDIDRNGTDDFLWKHTATGQMIEWFTSPAGGVGFQAALPGTNGYSAVATGDFNADGALDVLWRENATGITIEWLLSPSGGIGFQQTLFNVAGWSVLATGDFNADGTTDIIWERASDGATNEWLMAPGSGAILANPSLLGTGGVGVVHLTQEDLLVV